MPRRRKTEDVEEVEEQTPRKSRRTGKQDASSALTDAETPSNRKSILRGTPTKINGISDAGPTPKSLRKVLFSTPAKTAEADEVEETPTAVRNDHSARRKSARTLQKQASDDVSDDEDGEQEAAVAQEILDQEDSEEELDEEIPPPEPSSTTSTPSKRGRPKGKRRERTPSPPPDLPPHELYFFQNRGAAANKTSSNTLSSSLLLNHDDYFATINAYKDPHEEDIQTLIGLHKRAFDQWMFESEQGFNICLYGYGSKRTLAIEFAQHIHFQSDKPPKIIIVNGYTPGLTIRDILLTLASTLLPKPTKLPAQPPALLDLLLTTLTTQPTTPITLLIHSLDHPNLRKPSTQSTLARLASNSSINLIATVDTPNFGVLWDTATLSQYRWLYHDATTFSPYIVEFDAVEEVNVLLGRSGRRLGGKDGVGYVLKSLPENARNLFRILVEGQLASFSSSATDDPNYHINNDIGSDSDLGEPDTPSRHARGRGRPPKNPTPKQTKPPPTSTSQGIEGIEYRTLYHKAVEAFVCSSELNFRTLLKEFHDHQIIESRRDALGSERLWVPFRREELEGVLEELV